MGVFFWEFNDYNDVEREWICFILNIGVFLFTILALWRSLKFHRKVMFEILPLSFNLISTLVLLLLKLFQKGYQFDLIGYLIQIFTYFLFAFTFGLVLVKFNNNPNSSLRTKIYIISFILITAVLIVLILLVAIKAIDRKCDLNMVTICAITLSCQILSYIPAITNGKRIIKMLSVQKRSTLTETLLSQQIQTKSTLSDQFTIQRKKQIFVVLGIYTLSLLIRVLLLIFSLFIQDSDLIKCQQLQGIYIVTSDYFLGQFLLILIEINQLLPHIIIPLAIFIVPMKAYKKKHVIPTDSSSISLLHQEEQDDLQQRNDIIRSKVSSVLSDKADSPRRR